MSIFEQAVQKWGFEFQLAMVVEECAELIVAIQKANRKNNPSAFQERMERIVEEAVDVSLMIEQLKVMIPNEMFWNVTRTRKLEKLKRLLEEAKP